MGMVCPSPPRPPPPKTPKRQVGKTSPAPSDRDVDNKDHKLSGLTKELTSVRVVIVDLGNACWTNKHFSEDIQTRQYRSPEVITGMWYDTSADMWSLGCILFELLTGDLLFDPSPIPNRSGEDYDRDEDHLAQCMELLGKFPKRLVQEGKYSSQYFNRKGELRHIHSLKMWGLEDVLVDKYHFARKDAHEAANFILPMLEMDPQKRATAQKMLSNPWLDGVGDTDEEVNEARKQCLQEGAAALGKEGGDVDSSGYTSDETRDRKPVDQLAPTPSEDGSGFFEFTPSSGQEDLEVYPGAEVEVEEGFLELIEEDEDEDAERGAMGMGMGGERVRGAVIGGSEPPIRRKGGIGEAVYGVGGDHRLIQHGASAMTLPSLEMVTVDFNTAHSPVTEGPNQSVNINASTLVRESLTPPNLRGSMSPGL
ncbi:unnamed protein product [Discosporangium mesarthrocarpum]